MKSWVSDWANEKKERSKKMHNEKALLPGKEACKDILIMIDLMVRTIR